MGSHICQTELIETPFFPLDFSYLSPKIVKKKSNTVKQKVAKTNFPLHIQMQDLHELFKFRCLHLYVS